MGQLAQNIKYKGKFMRLILLLLLAFNLLNAKKIALLIGNSDYSFQPLSNPLNDVNGIYKTLREIGFESSNIKVLKNASKTKMEKALANFSQRATSAEIALVYFSGHGMQVNNTNYMFPAHTTAEKPVDLFGLVNLDYFIQSATSAKYGIILVDACRNNPLVKYFQKGKHKGTSSKKGLGQVTPTAGQVVIGFATGAGDTAEDGRGRMSPYAKALANRLKERNKDITKVLGLVALDVAKNHDQNPIIRTNLAYDVCLSGNCGKNYNQDEIDRLRAENERLKRSEKRKVNSEKLEDRGSGEFTPTRKSDKWVVVDGLMYQNDKPFTKEYTWEDGKKYCRNLSLDGYDDWRLPTRDELNAISNIKLFGAYDYDTSGKKWEKWFEANKHRRLKNSKGGEYFIKKEFVENLLEYSWFWTSTSYSSSSAWMIRFKYGNDTNYYKSNDLYVLCVRGQ